MSNLFGVAAAEGLRHLMADQVAGPHHVPVEAVRLLRSWGGEAISVTIRRRDFVVRGRGARIPALATKLWDTVLSGGSTVVAAMMSVEELGWQAPLWAVGGGATAIAVDDGDGGRFRWGAVPRSWSRVGASGDGVSIRVALRCSVDRSRRSLQGACRHAAFPVVLDGRDVRSPMRGGVFRVHLRTPVPAEVVLGVPDDVARIALLRHGVVAARVSIPGGWPPMTAAVDITGLTRDPCSAADCRDAVRPALRPLAEAAVDAGLRVSGRLLDLSDGARGRMVTLFLRAAAEAIRDEAVREASVLPCRRGGELVLVSVDEVAEGGGAWRRAAAGAPNEDGLVLGSEDVRLLEGLVGRRLSSAPAWPRTNGGRPVRSLIGRVRAAVSGVAETALSTEENRIAEAVGWVAWSDDREKPIRLVVVRGAMGPVRLDGCTMAVGRNSVALGTALAVLGVTDDPRLAALAVVPSGFRVRLTT